MHVRCGAAGGHSIRVVLPGVTLYDGVMESCGFLWKASRGWLHDASLPGFAPARVEHQVTGLELEIDR